MNDDTWLRDALRAATKGQPAAGDRARGAFRRAAQRRRQRLVAASCTAVLAVFVATAISGGPGGTAGLQPADPVDSPTATPTYETASPDPTPTAEPGDEPTADPTHDDEGAAPESPVPNETPEAPDGPAVPPHAVVDGGYGPVEVYFLLDGTTSMQAAHEVVADAVDTIVATLGRHAVVRHGFGVFRDTPDALYPLSKVYERLAPVSDRAGHLPRITYEGGGDVAEGHTYGLTGLLGIARTPYMMEPEPAGFSPRATRIVVVVSDADMKRAGNYPTVEETIRSLRAADVRVAGLAVETGASDVQRAYRDMAEVANGTGATARGSVDCDGNGSRDLDVGAPLVCETKVTDPGSFSGFAEALLALVARDRVVT